MEVGYRLRIPKIFPLAWGALVFCGFVSGVLLAPARAYDIYDVQAGLLAYSQQPLLVVGSQIVFAWAGVALIFMVLSFHEILASPSQVYFFRAATIFGLVSGALFLFSGLVGGFSSFDLIYIQSTRSTAYIQNAYLPLALIMNRAQAAAITVSGLWFSMANMLALRNQALPPFLVYLGLGVGGFALFGFFVPGGGFSLLSLLLGAVWGIFYGLNLHKQERQYNVDNS